MNGKTMLVIAGLCSIAVSGCTSLQSVSLNGKSNGNAPSGLTYRLPAKQFSVKATYEITKCTPKSDTADLDAKVSASFTESLIGAEAYTIDYQKLNGLTKVANTEFQLSETGLLTGVNVSIADQTGPVVSNVVTAAASIARAVTLPGISLLPGPNIQFQQTESAESLDKGPCELVNNFLKAKNLAETLLKIEKVKDADRAAAALQIREFDDRIKAFMNLAVIYEKLGANKDRNILLDQVRHKQEELGKAEKALSDLDESQTETMVKNWLKRRVN